jgi:dienelactone hydrolase
MKKIVSILFCSLILITADAQLQLTFPSKDGLNITADWYPVSSDMPIILLCHQDRSSRGEFSETALKLNKFGFNCLAVDLRVGDQSKEIRNQTALEANANKIPTSFEDAGQDIVAAVDYLYAKYSKPVIILGSSYSASLALIIAIENYKVSAVAAFSPGEYFSDSTYVRRRIGKLLKPVFATSSRSEADVVTDLIKDVNSRIKVQYIPSSKGEHGAKALWSQYPYNQEYWIALMSFLDKMKRTE